MADNKLINATGLWIQKDKNGNSYMSGTLGGVRVLIFKVKEKKSDKSPDYTLCFAPNEQAPSKKQEEEAPF